MKRNIKTEWKEILKQNEKKYENRMKRNIKIERKEIWKQNEKKY